MDATAMPRVGSSATADAQAAPAAQAAVAAPRERCAASSDGGVVAVGRCCGEGGGGAETSWEALDASAPSGAVYPPLALPPAGVAAPAPPAAAFPTASVSLDDESAPLCAPSPRRVPSPMHAAAPPDMQSSASGAAPLPAGPAPCRGFGFGLGSLTVCGLSFSACTLDAGAFGACSDVCGSGWSDEEEVPCQGRREIQQRLALLIEELFSLHDLNGDGVLEETELVRLNETVAVLHEGEHACEGGVVEAKYRRLFRERLDPDGNPVPFEIFRRYMKKLLCELDTNEAAQEMMMEQFVAEARLARQVGPFSACANAGRNVATPLALPLTSCFDFGSCRRREPSPELLLERAASRAAPVTLA
eukprot:TRINITY_DN19655_c0_g2_i1.p1 TRINITY_DN19655_c0_g2~~TRINITY_DN19655_c0_g2_i1.p1  ORF type:complete len:404 (+),score=108.14 TRINITY_DN19655_c0_g2_i1:133-1212(+)